MIYFIFSVCMWMIAAVLFGLALYMYMKFVTSVRNNEDIPGWMYKAGHAIKGRGADHFRNITNSAALKEANLFLLSLVIINIAAFVMICFKGSNVYQAGFFCLQMEFFFVVIARLLWMFFKIGGWVAIWVQKSSRSIQEYASTNAIVGSVFLFSFFLMLAVFMTGVPARPVEVKIAESEITLGKTKASELLQDGFDFYTKNPDDKITNQRDSHFYYGEMAELVRDGKSYGLVCLTPKWTDSSPLKDCIVTYYAVTSESPQFGEIKLYNQDIAALTQKDFLARRMVDIFSLKPAEFKENQGNNYFSLQLQLHPYMLWKKYSIEVTFAEDGAMSQYEVRTQHTIWE